MFRKPYKIKTSTTIKSSDRKKLKSLIENQFPALSSDDLSSLIPNKGEMNQAKALTHSGTVVMIYYSGNNPVFFQIWETYYPTLYTLWKYPNLLPTLTAVPAVIEKITNGADLMAPGIIITESTLSEMKNLKVKDVCALRAYGNKAPFAVGSAMMSAEELCIEGIKGKAMSVVHSFKDSLFLSGDQIDMPFIIETEVEKMVDIDENVNNEREPEKISSLDQQNICENLVSSEINKLNITEDDETVEEVPSYSMDEILEKSFLTAIKVSGKKINLPVLTSTFYGAYVLKSCPPALNLDIKKTTYKKLSVFLRKMQNEGLLEIKELTKGVESIISINLDNMIITSYHLDPLFKNYLKEEKEKLTEEAASDSVQGSYKFPIVTELFVISAQVKQLFAPFQMRKGDTVTAHSVRNVLKRYVKENSLQNEHNPKEVILDPILSDCIAKKGETRSVMTWEELSDVIISKMTHAYQIEFEDREPVTKKGKLEPIVITVDTRTGNKKVTLIQNLEVYGIKPEKIAQHVQVAVAASTSITPAQNGKGTLVLIQGNQVRYLQKLFLDLYKIPRKYLQGLENVPKKK